MITKEQLKDMHSKLFDTKNMYNIGEPSYIVPEGTNVDWFRKIFPNIEVIFSPDMIDIKTDELFKLEDQYVGISIDKNTILFNPGRKR